MWSGYLQPGRNLLKVYDQGSWYSKVIQVPWRYASNRDLPHRQYQIAPPEPREPLGSLFQDLQEYDCSKVVKDAVNSDTSLWKANTIIKTKKDYDLVVKLYTKHFVKLKDTFVYFAAQDGRWPNMTIDSVQTLC